jgi:hypothetical protein
VNRVDQQFAQQRMSFPASRVSEFVIQSRRHKQGAGRQRFPRLSAEFNFQFLPKLQSTEFRLDHAL